MVSRVKFRRRSALLVCLSGLVAACLSSPAAVQEVARPFAKRLAELRWVSYSPSAKDPTARHWDVVECARQDLRLLARHFDGLITYTCAGAGQFLPTLAAEAGFRGVIAGVWDPRDEAEVRVARSVAPAVIGYCVGNEGLLRAGPGDYRLRDLARAMRNLRAATGRPVTTSEPLSLYERTPELVELGDWVMPNVHPYWEGVREAAAAVKWTVTAYERLTDLAGGMPVLLKEVGFPTGGDTDVDAKLQADYYVGLAATRVAFSYFEGFDQRWKTHASVEPHWGLYTYAREPKLVMERLAPLMRQASPAAADVEIRIESPRSGGKATCRLTGDGGRIEVTGSSRGLRGGKHRALLFVHPDEPAAGGWYLQLDGVEEFADSGGWRGTVQVGNGEWPPRGGEKVSIAVIALPTMEAERLVKLARRRPGTPRERLPSTSDQLVAIVRGAVVELMR